MKGGRGHRYNPIVMPTAKFRRLGRFKGGYTIIEVIIVLAVTMALFAMIGLTFSRQQGRTSFQTSARELESQIRDLVNDISTGYYARTTNFSCAASGTGLVFGTGGTGQGTSSDCILLGRVIHFAPNGLNSLEYNVYSVAGFRQTPDGGSMRNIRNYVEARPRAIASTTGGIDITEEIPMPGGITVGNMRRADTGQNIHALGVFTRLGATAPDAEPGVIGVDFIPLRSGGSASVDKAAILSNIQNINDNPASRNPAGGILLCFNSQSSNQHALMQLGGNSRDVATDMQIREGTCPATPTF